MTYNKRERILRSKIEIGFALDNELLTLIKDTQNKTVYLNFNTDTKSINLKTRVLSDCQDYKHITCIRNEPKLKISLPKLLPGLVEFPGWIRVIGNNIYAGNFIFHIVYNRCVAFLYKDQFFRIKTAPEDLISKIATTLKKDININKVGCLDLAEFIDIELVEI